MPSILDCFYLGDNGAKAIYDDLCCQGSVSVLTCNCRILSYIFHNLKRNISFYSLQLTRTVLLCFLRLAQTDSSRGISCPTSRPACSLPHFSLQSTDKLTSVNHLKFASSNTGTSSPFDVPASYLVTCDPRQNRDGYRCKIGGQDIPHQ